MIRAAYYWCHDTLSHLMWRYQDDLLAGGAIVLVMLLFQ